MLPAPLHLRLPVREGGFNEANNSDKNCNKSSHVAFQFHFFSGNWVKVPLTVSQVDLSTYDCHLMTNTIICLQWQFKTFSHSSRIVVLGWSFTFMSLYRISHPQKSVLICLAFIFWHHELILSDNDTSIHQLLVEYTELRWHPLTKALVD